MPLVRVEVRNEYGLGAPELYSEPNNKEDPKALLEGLAVSGLVGILRQLGDLAEFAAEVFHGIQEQVTITSSRSHKLIGRVKKIEAALPPLEKLILAQRSHIHFAYTSGLNWRTHLQDEQSHFICSDLPRFMMDSYDQCRGPPHLNLLDKFDSDGPGSCLKRYSDPSFFRRTSRGSGVAHKKTRKIKKKRSWLQNGEVSRGFPNYSGRMQLASLNLDEQTSPSQTVSTFDGTKLNLGDQSFSFDSINGSIDFEHVSPRYPMQYREKGSVDSLSSLSRTPINDSHDFTSINGKDAVPYHDSPSSLSGGRNVNNPNQVTWDEKMDMLAVASKEYDHDETLDTFSKRLSLDSDDRARYHLQTANLSYGDEPAEAVSSNLDKEAANQRRARHFQSSEVYHPEKSSETFSASVNEERIERATQFDTAVGLDILNENEKQWMQVPDDVHHDGLPNGTVVQMRTQLENENVVSSNSGDFQPDDVESETDNYVDALNAIEPEYESDLDCKTKPGVEQHSAVENKANGDEGDRLPVPHSSMLSLNSENLAHVNGSFNVDTSGVNPNLIDPESCSPENASPDKLTSKDVEISFQFESDASFQPHLPDDSGDSSSLSEGSVKNGAVGNSNVKYILSGVSSYRQDTTLLPENDKSTSSIGSQKPPPESSSASSVKLWTNGGLLGLEPSKPPDCNVANVVSPIQAKGREDSSTPLIPKADVGDKSAISTEESSVSECSTSCQDDRKGGILTKRTQWKSMSADLGVNLLKLSNFQKDTFTQASAAVQPVCPDIESSRANEGKPSNSSRMFELGNSLLLSGFYRKPSLLKNEDSVPACCMDDCNFEHKFSSQNTGYQTVSARNREMLRSESPRIFPPSSPPLGHMKISFLPVNGSEAPKLQLKFPDGNISHEGGRDLFTSFQLVPDPSTQFCSGGSGSDDDTFCRSSLYESDCLSHLSESNSEQWESSESPSNKDKELYDALRRISMTESVSASLETGGAAEGENSHRYRPYILFNGDGAEHSHSSRLYDDLPSLDTINPTFREVRDNCNPELQNQKCFGTPLALLPPDLRAMKPNLDLGEDQEVLMPENLGRVLDGKLGYSSTQQPKPTSLNQVEIKKSAQMLTSKPQNLLKLSPERKVNQSASGNMDEKGDFLHQIRAKSFNLRRTATGKPTVTTGTTTSVQVTAILEKANAIRKAVGSDREDDNWSDA